MTDDKLKYAKEQGQAQYDSIREMVAHLNDDPGNDRAREAILEDALSVHVRTGWHEPGTDDELEEFEILLCWGGGPAARLIGRLNRYSEPLTVRMQVQDWFEPWTDFYPNAVKDDEDALLTYARCFYFGS
jgi:hypothetical protein